MQPFPDNRRPVKRRSRWFSTLVLLIGFALLSYGAFILAEARLAQIWASYEFDRHIPVQPAAPPAAEPAPSPSIPTPERGEWLGRLEIPRLDVSVMVREGDDDKTLRIAAGHLPGTALPGQAGTVAIAGHRDTFFRALRNIRTNDVIRLETEYGTHEYRVAQIKIVAPTATEVLESRKGEAVLSLITCYPFNYVGSAPKRFVVLAKETRETPVEVASAVAPSDGASIEKTSEPAGRKVSARAQRRHKSHRR